MNKLVLFAAVILSVLAVAGYRAFAQPKKEDKDMNTPNAKILIAYYSYSGNTRKVAQAIQEKTGGDLFEIKAEGTYPAEYRPMTEQVKKEIAAGFRPKLTTSLADISQYDVVFIGSPIWWGTIAPQVSSFIESYDLSGKTVIPFVTHGGGGKSRSFTDISSQCKGCNVEQNGWSGYGSHTLGISGWLENLGYAE